MTARTDPSVKLGSSVIQRSAGSCTCRPVPANAGLSHAERERQPYLGYVEVLLGTELDDTTRFKSAATVSRFSASVGWAGTNSS